MTAIKKLVLFDNKITRTRYLLPGLLLLVMLSACTTSSGEASKETLPPSSNQQTEIPIGVLLPATGPLAWVSDSIPALEMAVQEVNQAGGAAGLPLNLLIEDSEAEIPSAVSAATRLLDVQDVVALIGPTSITIESIMPLAQQRQVVMISPAAGTIAMDTVGGDYAFRTVSSDLVMGTGMAWYAANTLNAKTAAFFLADTSSTASIKKVLEAAASNLNLDITADILFIDNAPTYRAELVELATVQPDVIFFEAGPESAEVFFAQQKEMNLQSTWIGTDYMNLPFTQITGETSNGVIGINPAPVLTDRYAEWEKTFIEFSNKQDVPAFSVNGYDAVIMLALAIEAAGEPTREDIAGQLRQIANPPGEVVTSFAQGKALLAQGKDINYVGLAGQQDFNQFGDVVTSLQIVIAQDGALTRIGTLTDAELGDTLQAVQTTMYK